MEFEIRGLERMIVERRAVFFGLWLLPLGALIIKSGFVPRVVGYLKSRRITAGSQFPGELSQPRGTLAKVVGGSELARQHLMAPDASR
jgi:hypothetical protein